MYFVLVCNVIHVACPQAAIMAIQYLNVNSSFINTISFLIRS